MNKVEIILRESETCSEEINPIMTRKYDKFIGKNQECLANPAFANPFKMDDYSIYSDFLTFAQNAGYQNNLTSHIFAIHNFEETFFGTGRDGDKRIKLNNSLKDGHSINDYKGENCAMCFERSVLVHNFLHLFGYKSSLILRDAHAFVLIEREKNWILYDPVNYSIGKRDDKTCIYPSMKRIAKDEIDEYFYGDKTLEMDDTDLKILFTDIDFDTPHMTYKPLKLTKSLTV